MVKQSLQFLDAFRFSLKQPPVFLIRQSKQVGRPIIILYSVKMMDYPTIRQRLAVSFFPDQNMLPDIALWISSGMVWLQNKYIPCASLTIPSAFPLRMPVSFFRVQYPQSPSPFHLTAGASSGLGTHFFTAIWAVSFTSSFKIIKAFPTLLGAKALPFTLRRELFIALWAARLPFHTLIIRVIHK